MSVPARIKWIICLDGTSNSERLIDKSLTNVSRIRRCIATEDNERVRQVTYYHDGIGTGFKNPLNFAHQAKGDGIDMIIFDAYNYLCNNFRLHEDPGVKDEIFLIGFSRGAYAARCLADLVTSKGLLLKGERDKVHAIYEEWSRNSSGTPEEPDVESVTSVDTESTNSKSVESVEPQMHYPSIKACALWDTVSSVGTPIPRGILYPRFAFVNSELPEKVEHVFQALSLHEYRYHFSPIVLLPRNGEQEQGFLRSELKKSTFEQCWFAGYHADVGGGCKKDALAHFALVWMISRLERLLEFNIDNLFGGDFKSTTWIVGYPCGVRRQGGNYRLPVADSMSLGFMFGGSKYRIPQMEFWNEDGPYTPDQWSADSRQRMHASARFLSQRKLVTPLKCADGSTPTQLQDRSWQWTLHSKLKTLWDRVSRPPTVPPGQNIINEQVLSESEGTILKRWARKENYLFDKKVHGAGSKAPETVLIWLRDWLENPRGTAAPN